MTASLAVPAELDLAGTLLVFASPAPPADGALHETFVSLLAAVELAGAGQLPEEVELPAEAVTGQYAEQPDIKDHLAFFLPAVWLQPPPAPRPAQEVPAGEYGMPAAGGTTKRPDMDAEPATAVLSERPGVDAAPGGDRPVPVATVATLPAPLVLPPASTAEVALAGRPEHQATEPLRPAPPVCEPAVCESAVSESAVSESGKAESAVSELARFESVRVESARSESARHEPLGSDGNRPQAPDLSFAVRVQPKSEATEAAPLQSEASRRLPQRMVIDRAAPVAAIEPAPDPSAKGSASVPAVQVPPGAEQKPASHVAAGLLGRLVDTPAPELRAVTPPRQIDVPSREVRGDLSTVTPRPERLQAIPTAPQQAPPEGDSPVEMRRPETAESDLPAPAEPLIPEERQEVPIPLAAARGVRRVPAQNEAMPLMKPEQTTTPDKPKPERAIAPHAAGPPKRQLPVRGETPVIEARPENASGSAAPLTFPRMEWPAPRTAVPVARPEGPAPIVEPVAPAEPRVQTAREIRSEISIELPARGQGLLREERVSLRMMQRGEEVHVSVRASDRGLAQDLRSNLTQLADRLDQAGLRSEMWRPLEGPASAERPVRAGETRSSQGFDRPDSQRQDAQSGRDPGGRRQQQQPHRPQWVEELEKESRAERSYLP